MAEGTKRGDNVPVVRERKGRPNEATQPFREQKDRDAMTSYFLQRGDLRDYALFIFGIYTGRRIGDILALNVNDVAKVDGKGRLCVVDRLKIREQKTDKSFSFPLHPYVRRALSKYLRRRRAAAPSVGALLNEPLFKSQKPRRDGEHRITKRHALYLLTTAARACGLTYRVGTHSMRKTFGYRAYQEGRDIVLIQRALNHSSPEITLSYIGITQDDMDDLFYSFE